MLNNIALQGRLVADPELKTTQSGVSVVSFRIACERSYQTKDGERQADFIPCTAWRGTADFINKYFSKGDMILLQGSLQSRSYKDNDGSKRTAYTVNVESVNFCGSRKEKQDGDSFPSTFNPNDFEDLDDSDLPF